MALSVIYQQNNSGRSRTLVYRLSGRGYASEINNMLSAILYCWVHEIEFVLHSKEWNASCGHGWEEYFVPFYGKSGHRHLDKSFVRELLSPLWRMRLRMRLALPWFASPCQRDVWQSMRGDEFCGGKFDIPELGIKGDIFEAKRILLNLVHVYNAQTREKIDQRIGQQLNSIKPYVAVHIRRGDKVAKKTKEAELIEARDYVEKILSLDADIKNVFIATDDSQVLDQFEQHCPSQWRITTFCPSSRTGHFQDNFNKKGQAQIRREMLSVFADLQALSEAHMFVGAYSSNLSRLVALFRNGVRCHSMDEEWRAI